PATTVIYTPSLHTLFRSQEGRPPFQVFVCDRAGGGKIFPHKFRNIVSDRDAVAGDGIGGIEIDFAELAEENDQGKDDQQLDDPQDRKSTRLNSSHVKISY